MTGKRTIAQGEQIKDGTVAVIHNERIDVGIGDPE
jgi:hypothetical protein